MLVQECTGFSRWGLLTTCVDEQHHTTHSEQVEVRRRQAVEMARAVPDDRVALLLAVCRLSAAFHELPELETQISRQDFLFLKAIASEVDELPLGDERQYWAPKSLTEDDIKAGEYADRIRQDARAAFARIADNLQ